jgi:hypothetical protein
MLRLSRLWLWLLAWLSVQAVQAVRLQDTREYQDCVASVATCDALCVPAPVRTVATCVEHRLHPPPYASRPALAESFPGGRRTLTNQLLTGTIPPGVFTFTNLFALNLNSNRLTGTLSTEFGALTNLRSLCVPPQRACAVHLASLINHGPLSTTTLLSATTVACTNISPACSARARSFRLLSQNRLDGTIPTQMGELTALIIWYVRSPLRWYTPGYRRYQLRRCRYVACPSLRAGKRTAIASTERFPPNSRS